VEKYSGNGQGTDENIIRRMRIASWITKASNTHLEYVMLIAFPRQQWLPELASVLNLYVHCLSLSTYCHITIYSTFYWPVLMTCCACSCTLHSL